MKLNGKSRIRLKSIKNLKVSPVHRCCRVVRSGIQPGRRDAMLCISSKLMLAYMLAVVAGGA